MRRPPARGPRVATPAGLTLNVADLPRASGRAAASSAGSCVRRDPRMALPRSADPSRRGGESRSRRCRGARRKWASIATRDEHVCACLQTLVCVIRPITTISHPNPSRGVVRTPVPGRVIVQVRERPGNRLAWRGRVLPIMRRGVAQADSHKCFLLFAGTCVTVKTRREETLCVSNFWLRAMLHFGMLDSTSSLADDNQPF
jgi:hypothetical protein